MSTTLQKAEALLGRMLRGLRSSDEKLASHKAHALYPGSITVISEAFLDGMPIPKRFTQDDENISPPLSWSGVPEGTAELVLVCEDPDAPFPHPFIHWIMYHIPAGTMNLPENIQQTINPPVPAGARQSRNSAKKDGYIGPKPPLGHGVHHYHFQIFALDQKLNGGEYPNKDDLLKAMDGHVVGEGELVGTYERIAE